MERSSSNDQPKAPLPKRAANDASYTAPRPPGVHIGIAHPPSDDGASQPPPLIMTHSSYVPSVGGHERSYFPGTTSDPSHPSYQPYQPYQTSTEPSSSYQPSEIGEGEPSYSDEEVGTGQDMEEGQGEGYGNEGYTVHVIQPQGAWPGVRTTPYAGHPPPKPDFAVNHFASSEERLACLSDALRTFKQNEAIRQILGGNYNNYQLAPASQRLSNRRKSSAKDNSFTVTPEGGVRLGKNIRREGEWRPDTEAGRAAYERNQKEKEELAKLDPVGYLKNGVTEWPENDDKEEGATKKKKKNKKKSKKKGKKAVQVEEEDSGSDDRLEVDELDVAEEGGLAASVDEAGVKEADAEAEMAADELELPQSAKPAVTAEFAVEDAKSAPAVDLRQAPTPEPEATHVDSEEERNKRRAEKLKKAKERKNAKKERSAKRKEAMGIFRKPHAPDAEESLLAEGGVEGGVQGDVKPAAAETSATAPDSARAKEIARNLAVAGEVQAGRISSQAVQAISIEQTALQHVQPVQIQTPKPKPYAALQQEGYSTQSPLSSKTPLRPPQADAPHARHVSAKAQLSWTHLHNHASVSIKVTPPERPVSTPPLNFLAVPTSPVTPIPARLAEVEHEDPSSETVPRERRDVAAHNPSEAFDQIDNGSADDVGAGNHSDDAEETAVPDLTSSSTQTTHTAHVRTPESSPLRPLSKLPIDISLATAGKEEEEAVPHIHVESPSSRKIASAQTDIEDQTDRIASPTPTETSTVNNDGEGGNMLDVSYVQERSREAGYQDEDEKANAVQGNGSQKQDLMTHDKTNIDFDRLVPLAQTFILYFSDTDQKRLEARAEALGHQSTDTGGRSSAQSYSNGLVELIESSDVADLFGKWKALRRQVAEMTGREIEPVGCAPAVDKMGLGLHAMSDDHNFQFFIKGVKPMWEDRMCKMGGKISFIGSCEQLDSFFFETVLILISNVLPTACPSPGSDIQVVGVAFGRKPKPASARVDIWFGGMARVPVEYVLAVQAFLVQRINVEGVQVMKGGYKEFYANSHGQTQSAVGGTRKVSTQGSFGIGHARSISGTGTMGVFGQGQAMGAFGSFGALGHVGQVNQYHSQRGRVPYLTVQQGEPQVLAPTAPVQILQRAPTSPVQPSAMGGTILPGPFISPNNNAVTDPAQTNPATTGADAPGMTPPSSVPLVDVLAIPTDPMQSTVLPSTPLITPLVTPRVSPRPGHMFIRPPPPHHLHQVPPHIKDQNPYHQVQHQSIAQYGQPGHYGAAPTAHQPYTHTNPHNHPRPPRPQQQRQQHQPKTRHPLASPVLANINAHARGHTDGAESPGTASKRGAGGYVPMGVGMGIGRPARGAQLKPTVSNGT